MQSKKRKYYRRRNLFAEGGPYDDVDVDIDITKSGPLAFKQLQELNRRAYENRYSMGFSPEYIQFLEDNADRFYHESPSLGLQLSANKPIVSDQALQSKPFGSSRHDDFRELSRRGFDEGLNVGDARAENQPWWEKIINGVGKSVVTAGTSFADALGGLAVGVVEMPIYAIQGRDAATVVSRLWDNEFSHAMKAVQDWAEEVMPNYYTQEELNDPWYMHINANFIGDKVIKNLGFTAGMLGASVVGMGALNAASKAIQVARGVHEITNASRIVSNVVGSSLAGLNEARTEALQNAESYRQDAAMEWGDQIDRDVDSMAASGLQQELQQLQNKYRTELSSLGEGYLSAEDHIFKEQTPVGGETVTKTFVDENVQNYKNTIDQLQQQYQQEKEALEQKWDDWASGEKARQKEGMQSKIDHDAIRLGNVVMAVEAPMIALTDAVAWGSIFSRGYATHTATNIIMHRLPKGVAAGLTMGLETVSEGGQEYLQDVVSNVAALYYNSELDDYYNSLLDPDSEERTMSALKAFSEGWIQTAHDPNSWESFFIGSLSKVTGVMMPRTYRNSRGNLRMKLSFEGNIITDTREYLQRLREQETLERKATEAIKGNNLIQSMGDMLVRDDYYARQQESFANPDTPPTESSDFLKIFKKKAPKELLKEGSNKFNYENASHKRMLNIITLFSKLGRINELKERVSSLTDNLSDEDINSLVKNSTVIYDKEGKQIKAEDVKGQEVTYKGPFVDSQGNRLSNDEIREALQDKKQAFLNTIDNYRKIAKAVDLRYGGRLNIDDLQEVVWLESQLNNWGERAQSMAGDIKSVIDDALGVIQEDIDATQAIIDSTEEESKEHKQAVKDLEDSRAMYNDLMRFGNMSKKKLARKLALKQDIHGNLDNSAYAVIRTMFEAINNLKKTDNLSEKYNEQDLNDILTKLKDLVIIGQLRQQFMMKLNSYLSKPTEIEKKKLDAQREAQERKDNDKIRKIKESLSKASSLAEFRRAVGNINEDAQLISKAINELEKEGNSKAKNYKRTNAYRNAVLRAIDDSNASDEEKQDARTIFNDHYGNAETADELSSPEYREAESSNSFRTVNAGTTGLGKGAHIKFTDASGREVTGTILNSDAERNGRSGFVFADDSNPDNPEFISWQEAQRGKITNIQTPEEQLDKRYVRASMILGNAKREVNARDEWKSLFSTPQPNPGYTGNTSGKTSSSVDGSNPIDPVNPETTPTGTQSEVGTTTPVGGESMSKNEADKKRDEDNRGFDSQKNKDENSDRENNKYSAKNRPFYRPAIPYHDLNMLSQQKTVLFIDAKENPDNWRLLWDYLETTHAFEYVDNGYLHEGDEIGFMIDPQYETSKQGSTTSAKNTSTYAGDKNTLTIFMVTKDGQVVGSLDETLTEKFLGLTELRQQIEKEYNENKGKLKENEKFTSSLKTHVNQMMTGHLGYNYDENDPNKERSLAAIPGVMNEDGTTNAIFGILKGGVLDTNGALEPSEIVTPVGGEDGALYLMVPTGAGVYIPSRVTVAHFNANEFDITNATVKSTPLGSRIYELLEKLVPRTDVNGNSNNVTKESVKAVIEHLGSVLFTRDILLNYEERGDGIYLKFGHKVYDENGNPVYTESGNSQLTSNEEVKLATKIPTTITQPDGSSVTTMTTSWRTDGEVVFYEILNKFYHFNVPVQISVTHINKTSGTTSYNARLISSGALTSNLINADCKGTWFTTNPIVNGKEIKGVAPRKLGTTSAAHQNNTLGATEANSIGGTDSANPRSWISIVSVNTGKTYNVDMNTGKIYDAAGKEATLSDKNASLLRDLAKANQLYGTNTEGASMAGNIMIIEDTTSPYSVGSYRVLDRTTQTYLTGDKAQEVINRILGINPTQTQTTTPEKKSAETKNPSLDSSIYDNSIETLNPIDKTNKIEIGGKELSNGRVGYFVIKQDPRDSQEPGRVHKGIIYDLGEKGNTGLHVGIVKITTTESVATDIGDGEKYTTERTLDSYYAVFPNGNAFPIITKTDRAAAAQEAIQKIMSSSEGGTIELSNIKTAITDFFENYAQNPENQETTEEKTPQEETTKETTGEKETIENTGQPVVHSVSQGTTANENEQSVDEWLDATEDDEDPEMGDYKTEERKDTTVSPTIDGNTLNPDFVPEVGREYGIEAAEAVFNQEIKNSRGARLTKALANKVFALARKLGLKIVFDNSLTINNPGRYISNGTIVFSHRFFTRIKTSDKANIILHEVIHACTQYVLSDRMKGELNKSENKNLKEAVSMLNETYAELKANKKLSGQYGMTNVKEMVAEMSNPEFRRALKGTSLWERFKAAIKRLFGIKTSDNNYTRISLALDAILDNYNPALYEAYVKVNEMQEVAEISNLVRSDLKGDPFLVRFFDWFKNSPVVNEEGEEKIKTDREGNVLYTKEKTRKNKKGETITIKAKPLIYTIGDLINKISPKLGIEELNRQLSELVDNMFAYCKKRKSFISPSRVGTRLAGLMAMDLDRAKHVIEKTNKKYPDENIEFHQDIADYTTEELLKIGDILQEELDDIRRETINSWQDGINKVRIYTTYDEVAPTEKFAIISSLIKFFENQSESSPIKFLKPQFKTTLAKMRASTSKTAFNFYKEYLKTIGEELGDANTEVGDGIIVRSKDGLNGKWVRVNNESTSSDFETSVAKLKALSQGTNWCIRYDNAYTVLGKNTSEKYVNRYDRPVYAFMPDGHTTAYMVVIPIKEGEDPLQLQGSYAGIFYKDQTIGINNFDINGYDAIQTLYRETSNPDVKYSLQQLGYAGESNEERIRLKKEKEEKIKQILSKESYSIEDIEDLQLTGLPIVSNGDKLGLSRVTTHLLRNINLTTEQKGILLNKLFHSPAFNYIEEDFNLESNGELCSYISDTGNIERVGSFTAPIVISPKLKYVERNCAIVDSTSPSLGLEYVGGTLTIGGKVLTSVENLSFVGESLYIVGNKNLTTLGNSLKTVGKDLHLEDSYVKDLGGLERVGGNTTLSPYTQKASNLQFVGGKFECYNSIDLRNLKYIVGNARFNTLSDYNKKKKSNLNPASFAKLTTRLDALTYIDGNAYFHTNAKNLNSLETVAGNLQIYNSSISTLPSLKVVGKVLSSYFNNGLSKTYLDELAKTLNVPLIYQAAKFTYKNEKQKASEEKTRGSLEVTNLEIPSEPDVHYALKLTEQLIMLTNAVESAIDNFDFEAYNKYMSAKNEVQEKMILNDLQNYFYKQWWNTLDAEIRKRLAKRGYDSDLFKKPRDFVYQVMKCCGV